MGFSGFLEPEYLTAGSKSLRKAALRFLDKSRKHLGDNTIKTVVEEGDFADSILKAANKLNADIIILGSHSRKWLENIMMGSVTEQVLRHSSVPLIIIPTKKSN
jgi:nucleotide-binding universal stress UspA family protein